MGRLGRYEELGEIVFYKETIIQDRKDIIKALEDAGYQFADIPDKSPTENDQVVRILGSIWEKKEVFDD